MKNMAVFGNNSEIATLYADNGYTIFRFDDYTIRFKAPLGLERYTSIKEWDNGYLVVMAKYSDLVNSEEEYIDLIPILQDLYIEPEEALNRIVEVQLSNG